jgi:N-methylhydantoinase A
MPFGGAGPLFGTLLARELDIRSIVVPPYAGNFSAWGLLGSDLTRTAARTRIMRITPESIQQADRVLEELFAELASRRDGVNGGSDRQEIALDMRYLGQEHTITVGVGCAQGRIADDATRIRALFEAEYLRTFGHNMEEELEVVSMRATVRTPLPRRTADVAPSPARGTPMAATRAYSFTRNDWLEFPIIRRAGIGAAGLEGPVIVLEETATTYLDAGFRATSHPAGALLISDDDAPEA